MGKKTVKLLSSHQCICECFPLFLLVATEPLFTNSACVLRAFPPSLSLTIQCQHVGCKHLSGAHFYLPALRFPQHNNCSWSKTPPCVCVCVWQYLCIWFYCICVWVGKSETVPSCKLPWIHNSTSVYNDQERETLVSWACWKTPFVIFLPFLNRVTTLSQYFIYRTNCWCF